MLFQLGSVMFEPAGGASVVSMQRDTHGALADKHLLGGLPGHEWTGWSGEVTLTGRMLPFHLGGLGDVEQLHDWCASGTAVPLIRGDGSFLGWYAILGVQDKHATMSRLGIGYEVDWSVHLVRLPRPDGASIEAMIATAADLVARLGAGLIDAATNAVATLFE